MEKLAENFAAALLMPEANLKRAWEARSGIGDVHERLNEVAGQMGVSSLACKWRLRNLELLSKAEVAAIDDGLLGAKRGLACRTSEAPLFSGQFMQRVASALDAGRHSVKRAANLLGVSVAELARILHAYGHETYFEA